MQKEYGAKNGKGTIGGVHQTHHRPVTNSPHHPLRPPHPEGAGHAQGSHFIPPGHRGVRSTTSPTLQAEVPANMNAALRSQHQKLAKEVASGLRRFSFADVARNLPNPQT